jgi:hypothetical protein
MSSKTTTMIRVELHEDAKIERERNERKDDDEKWRERDRLWAEVTCEWKEPRQRSRG